MVGLGFGRCVRAARQAHGEDRTFARLARHGHIATHHARELAGDGEAKAGAAEALRGRVLPGDANAQRTRSEPRPNQLASGEDHETSNKEQKDRDS
jgi:hypothetical protein